MTQIKIDPEFQALLPPLLPDELDTLEASILSEGCREPLTVWGDILIDGHNRLSVCQKHGVEYRTRSILFDSRSEAALWIIGNQRGRRNLSESQRAMLAAREASIRRGGDRRSDSFKAPMGALKQADLSEKWSVGERSVQRARQVLEHGSNALQEAVTRGEIKVRPAAELTALPAQEQDEIVARGRKEILAAAKKIRDESTVKALTSSETNEWYTPTEITDAAREMLGEIDLDPASCFAANKMIRAQKIFTSEQDGLRQRWHGHVWLNPPYGRDVETNESNQGLWARTAIEKLRAGEFLDGIILLSAVPDRGWFNQLWNYPICFVRDRIKFINSDSMQCHAPINGSVLVYLGEDRGRRMAFADLFKRFGPVVLESIR